MRLPSETWLEVLGFIDWNSLGERVSFTCRRFSRLGSWLLLKHVRKIPRLIFTAEQHIGPSKKVGKRKKKPIQQFRSVLLRAEGEWKFGQEAQTMEIAEEKVPDNIIGFQQIKLLCFDERVFRFFRAAFSPLLSQITVRFDHGFALEPSLRVLTSILPYIEAPLSLAFAPEDVDLGAPFDELEQLLPQILSKVHFLSLKLTTEMIPLLMEWLNMPAKEEWATPKKLLLFCPFYNREAREEFQRQVKKEFLNAKNPSTFVIRLIIKPNSIRASNPPLLNHRSREQFVEKHVDSRNLFYHRCPLSEETNQMNREKTESEMIKWTHWAPKTSEIVINVLKFGNLCGEKTEEGGPSTKKGKWI